MHTLLCIINSVVLILPYLQAHSKNDAGNYQDARTCGLMALCCNITVIVYHVILWIILIVIIGVYASRISTAALSGGNSGSESACTWVQTMVCHTYSCSWKYVLKCN